VGQHILINHATYVGLRDHPEIITTALGEHKVKGRTEPVIVHAVNGIESQHSISTIAKTITLAAPVTDAVVIR
jgi:class 3 adenylate cyclase